MDLDERIISLTKLGSLLRNDFVNIYRDKINEIYIVNPWFTAENVECAINYWGNQLNLKSLKFWLKNYKFSNNILKNVLVISAGNIPLVSFHDILCILFTGHKLFLKLSSKDNVLLPLILNELFKINSEFENQVFLVNKIQSEKYDAVLATGNDSTAKYFDYYFKNKKKIIRKTRSSVAIIQGNESDADLDLLADDVFKYFGLGCRSISQILVPINYDLNKLFKAFYKYRYLINHQKYMNNYEYYKTILLMDSQRFFDNGFLLIKNSNQLHSPVSLLNYFEYSDIKEVNSFLKINNDQIQCIISKRDSSFGNAQKPKINSYADNVDVIDFLTNL
tara:strand:+ start:622 stop:1623 length:1002 start_codon:yes stop_codon:yes gene_type:complete